jgi:glycine/serine hydroxymethyltransferase
MGPAEMTAIADMIATVLAGSQDPAVIQRIKARVAELCGRFPVYA